MSILYQSLSENSNTFFNGDAWITNNRCERGEILGDPKDKKIVEKVQARQKKKIKFQICLW